MNIDVNLKDLITFTLAMRDVKRSDEAFDIAEKVATMNGIKPKDAFVHMVQFSVQVQRVINQHPNFVLSDEQRQQTDIALASGGMEIGSPLLEHIAQQNGMSTQNAMIILMAMEASTVSSTLPVSVETTIARDKLSAERGQQQEGSFNR